VTYTTPQVAKKIGVRPQTLEKWLLNGLKSPRKRYVDGAFVRLWEENDLERAREFSVQQTKPKRQQDNPGTAGIRVYTSTDVAKHLKVSKMTIMRWVNSGSVKKPKLFIRSRSGTVWLWTKEELVRLSNLKNLLFDPRGRRPKGRSDMTKRRVKRASNRKTEPNIQPQVKTDDPVEEASKESFPASDSPAWNAGKDPPTPPEKK
jgi:DNA-binding XRE family transcriptional regulator